MLVTGLGAVNDGSAAPRAGATTMPTATVPPTLAATNACPAESAAHAPVPGRARPGLTPRVYVVDNHIPPDAPAGTPYLVDVIDPATSRVIRTISVGAEPHHIYPVPGENEAYVTHFINCEIDVVDLATNRVIGTIPTAYGPRHLAFDPGGNYAYAVDYFDERLTVIDTRDNRAVGTIKTGPYPNYPQVTADGRRVYIVNSGSNTVTVAQARPPFRVIRTIVVGQSPFDLALTPDGKLMLVANAGDNTVSFIDTHTLGVVATVPTRIPEQGTADAMQKLNIRITANGRYAWIGDQAGSAASVIDIAARRLSTVLPASAGSDTLFQIGGGPSAGLGLMTARYGDFLDVVRPDQPSLVSDLFTAPNCSATGSCAAPQTAGSGTLGSGSHQVAFSPGWLTAYVSDRPGSAVSEISLAHGRPKLLRNIPTSYFPYGYPDGIAEVWFSHGEAQTLTGG
jgi:YVTN family beta-propeller protein